MRSGFFVLLSGIVLLATSACGDDDIVEQKDVLGTWEVIHAKRNGKPTELINGAVFKIADSTMSTDFTGFEKAGKYAWEDGLIKHLAEGESVYEIVSLRSDTMNLRTKVEGLKFDMQLTRQAR